MIIEYYQKLPENIQKQSFVLYKAGAPKNPANPRKKQQQKTNKKHPHQIFFSKLCFKKRPIAGAFLPNPSKPLRTPPI